MKRLVIQLMAVVLLPCVNLHAQTQTTDVIRYGAVRQPVRDSDGMVASANMLASEIGAKVLAEGGTAVDAAVAVGFAMAVVRPRAGNIGGGGFMLVYSADDGKAVAIDYREAAPRGASRDMFLDEQGVVDPALARFSHLSSAVPGTVAGLRLAHERFGKLPWKRLLAPAIRLAAEGFSVSYDMSLALERSREKMARDPSSIEYFYKSVDQGYQAGERFVQSDLAWSLTQIAEQGPDAFYRGEIAKKIIAEM
jgi:gamma-glutamyltranspeptidase/glutathione hydrolase